MLSGKMIAPASTNTRTTITIAQGSPRDGLQDRPHVVGRHQSRERRVAPRQGDAERRPGRRRAPTSSGRRRASRWRARPRRPDRPRRIGDALDDVGQAAFVGLAVVDRPQAVAVDAELVCGTHQRAVPRQDRRDVGGRDAAMLAQQPVADLEDGRALAIAARLDGEVAFGVGAHRAVVHVGRADAQEAVVDHHDLGMDHGVGRACRPARRRDRAAARGCRRPRGASARSGCGRCAWYAARPRNRGVRGATITTSSSGQRLQAIGQPIGDQRRGQELVLDVDRRARPDRWNRRTASRPRATASSPS